ncbi:ABC transporter substrate-binding protein [Anaerolineales bacterium HSG25]|nr:ABC transporter substrate-binding protein [Anaerolineales bacterium HSG25]
MLQKIIALLMLLTMMTACGQNTTSPSTETDTTPDNSTSEEPVSIQLGVGYIPNVQFAPYYVAKAKGFFADEGLDVSLEHGFETDFVALTAKGDREFAVASGDQVILSRAQGLPIVYVMKWYERFPIAIMAPKDSGIDSPEALTNHTVGIPGPFGASYVAWKALLYATGVDESSIDLESIGFTQAEAVSTGQVDAAVVYIANEPIQLSQQGIELNIFEISDYIDLVSNGIVTNETVIKENPELVQRMVRASLRGLQYTIDNPDEAFDIVRQEVAEITDEDAPTQRMVLDASIELWKTDQFGKTSPEYWVKSIEFMKATGLLEGDVDIDRLYSNDFVTN